MFQLRELGFPTTPIECCLVLECCIKKFQPSCMKRRDSWLSFIPHDWEFCSEGGELPMKIETFDLANVGFTPQRWPNASCLPQEALSGFIDGV